MSLARQAMRGAFWAYGAFVAERLTGLAISVILARLLLPEDFGLIAFALVCIAVIDACRDGGIKDALVWAPAPLGTAADTAFALGLLIGLVQAGALLLLAPLATLVIDDSRLVELLRVLALVPLLNALGATHEALLQRRLAFRQRYLGDLAAAAVKAVATIALVWQGYGVLGVGLGLVAGTAVRTLLRWLLAAWLPTPRATLREARMLLGYGMHVMAVSLLDVLIKRLDHLVIAALLGPAQLGYYFIAVRLPELILTNFGVVLTRVLFPAYATISDQRVRLVAALHATMRYTAFLTIPVGLGMVAVAPELIPVMFGEPWRPSVPVLQLFAIGVTAVSLPWSAGDGFKAAGRPDLVTRLTLLEMAYALPLIFGLTWLGRDMVMTALGFALAMTLNALIHMLVASRFFGFGLRVYARLFGAPLAAGLLMLVAVTAWRSAAGALPEAALLASSIGLGALVYAGAIWLLAGDDVRQGLAMLRAAAARRAVAPAGDAATEALRP